MLAASLGLPVVTMAPAPLKASVRAAPITVIVVIERQSAARGDGHSAIAPRIAVERDGCAA